MSLIGSILWLWLSIHAWAWLHHASWLLHWHTWLPLHHAWLSIHAWLLLTLHHARLAIHASWLLHWLLWHAWSTVMAWLSISWDHLETWFGETIVVFNHLLHDFGCSDSLSLNFVLSWMVFNYNNFSSIS